METLHHKPIKKFGMTGLISDEASIPKLKIKYTDLIRVQMQIKGYVPRLDIGTDFTVYYNENKEYFEFKISIYGIYVGRKKAEWIAGIDGNKVIYTLPNRLEESSTAQV